MLLWENAVFIRSGKPKKRKKVFPKEKDYFLKDNIYITLFLAKNFQKKIPKKKANIHKK
jgi:hypothetical protein